MQNLKSNRVRLAMLSGAAIACLGAAPAFAQNADGENATEDAGTIFVTARKREERLQDVPISVSAVSSAEIDGRGWDSVTDVQQATPNISFTPGQGGNSGAIAPFIRGIPRRGEESPRSKALE